MRVVFKYMPSIEETLTIAPPFPPLFFPNLASEILLRSITAFCKVRNVE